VRELGKEHKSRDGKRWLNWVQHSGAEGEREEGTEEARSGRQ